MLIAARIAQEVELAKKVWSDVGEEEEVYRLPDNEGELDNDDIPLTITSAALKLSTFLLIQKEDI